MFQFSGSPSAHYGFMYGCIGSSYAGFPIRTSPDRWIFAPPRGFSQLITSFIGSQCQGIRPAPFLFDLSMDIPPARAALYGSSPVSLMPISSSPFRHSVGYSGYPCLLLYVRARDRFALTCSRAPTAIRLHGLPPFRLMSVDVADPYAALRINTRSASGPRRGPITHITRYLYLTFLLGCV